MRASARWLGVSLATAWMAATCLGQGAGPWNPSRGPYIIPANPVVPVSAHVSAIMAYPNVAFVIGTHATLVVDTGLGPRNGATVAGVAKRLSKGTLLYLTTTHYHPEHASGDNGFPADTILIRPEVQQQELDQRGMAMVAQFSRASAAFQQLLQNVHLRAPDIVFDKQITLDLGGVTARLFWLGPAHTNGDELIDVEPDRTLIPGDVVQNQLVPNLTGSDSTVKSWIQILAELRSLAPLHVVPDHGTLGDGSLIGKEYDFLTNLQSQALALKSQGQTASQAGQTILAEFKRQYATWPNLSGVPAVVRRVYTENP